MPTPPTSDLDAPTCYADLGPNFVDIDPTLVGFGPSLLIDVGRLQPHFGRHLLSFVRIRGRFGQHRPYLVDIG